MGKKLIAAIGGSAQSTKASEANSKKEVVPEVDIYLAVLVQVPPPHARLFRTG